MESISRTPHPKVSPYGNLTSVSPRGGTSSLSSSGDTNVPFQFESDGTSQVESVSRDRIDSTDPSQSGALTLGLSQIGHPTRPQQRIISLSSAQKPGRR